MTSIERCWSGPDKANPVQPDLIQLGTADQVLPVIIHRLVIARPSLYSALNLWPYERNRSRIINT